MTIDKAIKILGAIRRAVYDYDELEEVAASKFGIEAIKKIQDIRTRFPTLMPDPLPGEDFK